MPRSDNLCWWYVSRKNPRASRNTFGWSSQTSGSEVFNFCKLVKPYPVARPNDWDRASSGKFRPGGRKRLQGRVAIHVILVVVREILSVTDAPHPLPIGFVPIDSLPQALF